MKRICTLSLLLSAAAGAFGQTKNSPRSVEQTLMQLERDWSQADSKKDVAALDRIMAADWIGIDFQGVALTKTQALADAKSPSTALEASELGDMKVRVYGTAAVVSGTEIEKSKYKNKDSSGQYIWTDVFVLRAGRWQAVASQSTKIAAPDGPKAVAQAPGIRAEEAGYRRHSRHVEERGLQTARGFQVSGESLTQDTSVF